MKITAEVQKVRIYDFDDELIKEVVQKIKDTEMSEGSEPDEQEGTFDFIINEGGETELHCSGDITEYLNITSETYTSPEEVEITGRSCNVCILVVHEGECVKYEIIDKNDFKYDGFNDFNFEIEARVTKL